ncbi:hypothetical protein ABD90_15105 [Lysinibacillus fusiformis]|uniref:Uncharacterized protein n=2 Tax=Lysinibacillus sphaericus TaxID=1421 RepID=W7RM20_LYSSH|nr:hypothetical protein [Lysinibacillus sphaericus]ACA42187.1 hypothetical protein Bsph_4743 [Lysinibacillus sphaericus C3-41]EWH31275.1 hypothetical protein P799_20315 [Lysinibacillus sphaericus CBAM5]MBG9726571.1 hypothetical protein [Lysinibacillus fusiformis]AMO31563.1 hypothetical protein AR327_03195 [Lysinibacillus sphaericus]AMR89322.1 hypothetical protein A1T07_03475 [Lysinibacillus sphaericus]
MFKCREPWILQGSFLYPKRIVKDNKNGIEKLKVISFKMNTKNEIIENDITYSLMVSDKIGIWLSVSRI